MMRSSCGFRSWWVATAGRRLPGSVERELCPSTVDRDAQDLAEFALGSDFKRSAADFAVGHEPLRRDAGVGHQFHARPQKGQPPLTESSMGGNCR